MNAYCDLDPSQKNGSDVVLEINAAAGAGRATYLHDGSVHADLPGLVAAVRADQRTVEFAIPVTDFTQEIPGLAYHTTRMLAVADGAGGLGDIVLRISQSFGYTAAGGPTFGATGLGSVTLAGATAVPAPVSLALLAAGLCAAGAARRRGRAPTPA